MILLQGRSASRAPRVSCVFMYLFMLFACQGAPNGRRRPVRPQTQGPRVSLCLSLCAPARGGAHTRARALFHTL